MREIKFRAWDRKDEEWVYVTLTTGEAEYEFEGSFNWHDLEPWQQFTGLTDKNGKEIYEGDFIEIDGGKEQAAKDTAWSSQYRAAVEWEEGGARYCLDRTIRGIDCGGHDLSFLVPKLSIIGNVYETPELLK